MSDDFTAADALAQAIDGYVASAYIEGQAWNAAATALMAAYQGHPASGTAIDHTYTFTEEEELGVQTACLAGAPLPLLFGQCYSPDLTGKSVLPAVWPDLLGKQLDFSGLISSPGIAATVAANLTKTPVYIEAYNTCCQSLEPITAIVRTMDAAATQPTGVVDFYIDGTFQGSATLNATGIAVFNANFGPAGRHWWVASYRQQGQWAAVSSMPFPSDTYAPLPDAIVPTITGIIPAFGTKVTRGSVVSLKATGADNVAVTKMETYAGGVLRCTDTGVYTSHQYTCAWTAPAQRNIVTTIMWKAYDAAGNVRTVSGTLTTK